VAQDVDNGLGSRSYGRDEAEQPIELRRHLDALRRSLPLIVALVAIITGAAVGISIALPKSYDASARILYNASADPLANASADVVQRQLATIGALITTPATLARSAAAAGVAEPKLEKKVKASVDQTANLIDVTASDRTAAGAMRIANAVARTFLEVQRRQDLQSLAGARARLLDQLAALGGAASNRAEADAIRTRLSELTVSEATAGSELQLAQPAQEPGSPTSPRPVRNGIVAFFASIFLGILLALGRDQLVPRVNGPRELTRITDWPTIGTIPFVRRRFGRQPTVLSGPEHEAYQTLQATIRFQLPPTEQHIILVTSALEDEGKTTVSVHLGKALARAGRKTLVISGDMRHPKLHERFGIEQAPGLAEVLTALSRDTEAAHGRTMSALRGLLQAQAGSKGNLHVLPAGKTPADPGRLLMSNALSTLFDQLRSMDYSYVLIDGTPLLGIADSQSLLTRVDDVIVVSRLDRLRVESVIEMRDIFDRLDVTPLGHVVVGGRRTSSSYYYNAAPAEFDTA
jgi:capsular exopolysaccharide synthesis family protein